MIDIKTDGEGTNILVAAPMTKKVVATAKSTGLIINRTNCGGITMSNEMFGNEVDCEDMMTLSLLIHDSLRGRQQSMEQDKANDDLLLQKQLEAIITMAIPDKIKEKMTGLLLWMLLMMILSLKKTGINYYFGCY